MTHTDTLTGRKLDAVEKTYEILSNDGSVEHVLEIIRTVLQARWLVLEIQSLEGHQRDRQVFYTATHNAELQKSTNSCDAIITHGTTSDSQYRLYLHGLSVKNDLIEQTASDLLRHLCRAYNLAKQQQRVQVEHGFYVATLDRLAVGTIFLNKHGKILQTNKIAQDILDAKDGLMRIRSNLAANDPQTNTHLQSCLRARPEPEEEHEDSLPLIVRRSSNKRDLGILIKRTGAQGTSNKDVATVIILRDPDHSTPIEKLALRKLFAMTSAEAEVACLLTAGKTLDDAASTLNISKNTARTHLRSIFSKGDISRQTELLRVILSSVAVFG
ncbi:MULTISPECIES: LuxR C-terminal-related transcriptional regulator [unclassified Pseudovibrio]|uniref:helix-turn-helix transcriptional regulator n=1 Tax=unclassified Pseudovibrio TaxID=2627060 RepID=UPI00070FD3B4|nr:MULTISPECIES: LuxR C-terminal-related transcriptional regulator [unclassified Pseudovibrio]